MPVESFFCSIHQRSHPIAVCFGVEFSECRRNDSRTMQESSGWHVRTFLFKHGIRHCSVANTPMPPRPRCWVSGSKAKTEFT